MPVAHRARAGRARRRKSKRARSAFRETQHQLGNKVDRLNDKVDRLGDRVAENGRRALIRSLGFLVVAKWLDFLPQQQSGRGVRVATGRDHAVRAGVASFTVSVEVVPAEPTGA